MTRTRRRDRVIFLLGGLAFLLFFDPGCDHFVHGPTAVGDDLRLPRKPANLGHFPRNTRASFGASRVGKGIREADEDGPLDAKTIDGKPQGHHVPDVAEPEFLREGDPP